MNYIKNSIKKNISFVNLINGCKNNFYLRPSSKDTKKINKKFINFYKKKIKKNQFIFDFDKKNKIFFPYIKMGKITSLGLFAYHEHNVFLYYLNNFGYYKKVADIGGNIGLHSIILSKMGYKVDVFEPDPKHFKLLKANLKKNKCKNVKTFNKAVFNIKKNIQFTRVLGNPTANHISGYKENLHGKVEKLSVETVDIKKIVKNYDLIKMDAEGSEGKIIERLNRNQLNTVDIICEISGEKNAKRIFKHCRKNKINIFSHRIGWKKAKKLTDLPIHHLEGLIIITGKTKLKLKCYNAV